MDRLVRPFSPGAVARAAALALCLVASPFAPARAAAATPGSTSAPAEPAWILVRAGTLIDGSGGKPRRNVDVLVRDGRIEQVGSNLSAPPGAGTLDLSGQTVLPGLIDCHTHLTFEVSANSSLRAVTETAADQAIQSTHYARRTLEAGFTTVRNVGASDFVDVALKKAIDKGLVPGPRMIVSTNSFSIVGGHGDANGYRPGILEEHLDYTQGLPTGPDECRKAVRYAHKHGAGVIKIMSTGGVLSANDALDARSFSDAELAAIVDEAKLLGLKVCSHAHGIEGIKSAVKAGVASIEHGTYLDEETARLMKEKGCWLVPTRSAGEWVYDQATRGGIPPHAVQKALQVGPVMRDAFRIAHRNGVKIAFGSDSGVFPHGTNAQEFRFMTDLGMSPMEAIVSATRGASELLGWSEVGLIEKGRYADFVAVAGDPLADITLLERPVVVVQGGRVVRDDRAPAEPGATRVSP
jgi:imidazolonepropionase-like amidohydrolase